MVVLPTQLPLTLLGTGSHLLREASGRPEFPGVEPKSGPLIPSAISSLSGLCLTPTWCLVSCWAVPVLFYGADELWDLGMVTQILWSLVFSPGA